MDIQNSGYPKWYTLCGSVPIMVYNVRASADHERDFHPFANHKDTKFHQGFSAVPFSLKLLFAHT